MNYQIVPVTPFEQNCTLIWCEETAKAAVVDPGGDLERLFKVLTEHDLQLDQILLTHAHIDHAGAAGMLAKLRNIPIVGPHQGDRFWIEQMPQQSKMFDFPPVLTFEPDRWLEQGDQVRVGNEILEVRHCPGHTPGHVIFYSASNKLAFVGDVLFRGSIGRTDFPGSSHEQLLASIRQQLWTLGDEVQVIPGHGPLSSIGLERATNPFLQ